MKLLLVRHGESAANAEGRLQGQFDSPLSDRGREQAQALADRLGREIGQPSAIHASDLSRATETATIIGSRLEMPVVLDPRLREYDFGEMNGVIWREAEFLYPNIWRSFQQGSDPVPVPGEEGRWAFRKRLASALADIRDSAEAGRAPEERADRPPKNHGDRQAGPQRAREQAPEKPRGQAAPAMGAGTHESREHVVVVTHGGALSAIMADLLGLEPGWPRPFWFDNASLSIVEYHSRGPVITRLNDVCHLKDWLVYGPLTPRA